MTPRILVTSQGTAIIGDLPIARLAELVLTETTEKKGNEGPTKAWHWGEKIEISIIKRRVLGMKVTGGKVEIGNGPLETDPRRDAEALASTSETDLQISRENMGD
jgi:hypothetical protein